MNNKFDLTQYMQAVFSLETEKRALSIALQNNENLVSRLGKTNYYKKPEMAKIKKVTTVSDLFWVSVSMGMFFLGGAFFDGIVNSIFDGVYLGRILGTLCALLPLGQYISERNLTKRMNEEKRQTYEHKMEEYERSLKNDKRRVERERTEIVAVNKNNEIVRKQYNEVSSLLKKYYDLNVIHPQYRNLMAVGMFSQYLETGRCTKLEGHEGCYNLFEQEKRMGTIITKLDVALQKLDGILEGQYNLQEALRESNATANRLCCHMNKANRTLDTMRQQQAVIAYQAEQAADNARFLATYTVMRDLV